MLFQMIISQFCIQDSAFIVDDTLQDFNMGFSHNDDTFLSLAYGFRDVITNINTVIVITNINNVDTNSNI